MLAVQSHLTSLGLHWHSLTLRSGGLTPPPHRRYSPSIFFLLPGEFSSALGFADFTIPPLEFSSIASRFQISFRQLTSFRGLKLLFSPISFGNWGFIWRVIWSSFLLGTRRSRSFLFWGKYSWKGGGFQRVLGLVLVGVFWLRNDLGLMGLLIVWRSCRDGRFARSAIVLLVWVMPKRDFATCVWWSVFHFVFCDFFGCSFLRYILVSLIADSFRLATRWCFFSL